MDTQVLLSALGLLLAFTGMALAIFRKVSPILIGPTAAVLLCVFSGLPIFPTVVNEYVPGVGGFFTKYFLIFLLGSIFGTMYQISGAASKVGEILARVFGAKKPLNCMTACLIAAAVLSYGGINSFVIIFAVYPIARKLFEEANISTDLLPGIVAGGMWTFAMTGPFTPQIPNIIPMENLGTTAYAGLVPGVIGSVCMAALIVWYMTREAKRSQAAGRFFERAEHDGPKEEENCPNGVLSFLPITTVVLGFNLSKINIVVWLLAGVLLSLVLFWKQIPKKSLMGALNGSAAASIDTIMNTAAIVGFGSVVKLTPMYAYAVTVLVSSTANPYVVAAVGSNVFAGILGSASGGVGLMFSSLKDAFLGYIAKGYNAGYIHRLCAFGCGGLDSLPWNGSIVSIFKVCGKDHRSSYRYIFVNCLVIPIAVTFLVVLPICMFLG